MQQQFTEGAHKLMSLANNEAISRADRLIGPEHIGLALIRQRSGVAATMLREFGVTYDRASSIVTTFGPNDPGKADGPKLKPTPQSKTIIFKAVEEARGIGHPIVGTEHFLLALAHDSENRGTQLLRQLGLRLDQIRAAVLKQLSNHSPVPTSPVAAQPASIKSFSPPPVAIPQIVPVETPTAKTAPIETPPVETVPIEIAPVETPQVESPRVEIPPVEAPPIVAEPVITSPLVTPPVTIPAVAIAAAPPMETPSPLPPPVAEVVPVIAMRAEPRPKNFPEPVVVGRYSARTGIPQRAADTLTDHATPMGDTGDWPLGDAHLFQFTEAVRFRKRITNAARLYDFLLILSAILGVVYLLLALFISNPRRLDTQIPMVICPAVLLASFAVLDYVCRRYTLRSHRWPSLVMFIIFLFGAAIQGALLVLVSTYPIPAPAIFVTIIILLFMAAFAYTAWRAFDAIPHYLRQPAWCQELIATAEKR